MMLTRVSNDVAWAPIVCCAMVEKCTKREPRSRHKLNNYANLLAIRVEQIIDY